ncbi:hypothetical protein RQP54_06280 [Curvibacter sp. APW13]|uniref:hypothetical protein n=1 Tax=Curvibacter sp. APW13 TaxID=3077236 RepID=UPI0028E005E7|nr:hypothetical protein [Curvibacter sp. APW13]MDT8990471.1 hypothetical protein [Curvibacter sp. APW13]
MTLIKYIVGGTLVAFATSSLALTIGSVRGDVWLEQALELVVPIQMDTPADATTVCPIVELSYGDSTVDPRLVRVAADSSPDSDVLRLRISSAAPVNDAVVNLVVQAGCAQKVVRRFQLLPDVQTAAATAPLPAVQEVPLLASPPATPSPDTAAAKPFRSAPGAGPAGADRARKPPSTPARAKARPPAPTPPPDAGAGGARLTLDPLSAVGQRGAVPLASQAPDPDMMAAQEELQKLRADYLGLQLQAARTETEFASLREHLAKAESERNMVIMVAGGAFAAMVVVVAAGLVWWGRKERERLRQQEALDDEEQELLSDLNAVAADKWQAPAPFRTAAVEEEVTVAMPLDPVVVEQQTTATVPMAARPGPAIDIDIDLPLGQQGYRL